MAPTNTDENSDAIVIVEDRGTQLVAYIGGIEQPAVVRGSKYELDEVRKSMIRRQLERLSHAA